MAGVFDTPEARRNYILGEAAKRGIDTNLIDRLVRSEGGYAGYDMTGDHGQSFGPFQDYIGGGLGNQMIAQGLDPRNPANERPVIGWNLDYIQTHGASPDVWHGLRPGEARWTGGAGSFDGAGGPLYLGTVEKMAGVPEAGTDLLGFLLMQHAPPEEVKGGTGNELLDAVVGNSIYGSPPQAGPGPDETPPQRFPQPAAPPQTVQAQPVPQMAAQQVPQPQITPQQPIPSPQLSALSRALSSINPIGSAQAAETAPSVPTPTRPPQPSAPPSSGTGSPLLDGLLKSGVAALTGGAAAPAAQRVFPEPQAAQPAQQPAQPPPLERMLTGIGAAPSAKTDIEQAQIEQQQAQQPPASIPQRIADLGSAVLPYVAGGAPAGSLGAGLRFGRGPAATPQRFQPPPLQTVNVGAPPAAAAAAAAPASAASKFWNTVKETASKAREDLQIKTTPMAAGPERGVRVAKEFANAERLARFNRMHFDKLLRRFTPQQWNEMWEAMDRASVTAQVTGNLNAGFRHIAILPKEMRDVVVEMEKFGIDLWQKAKSVGMVDVNAERLPFYVTRGVVKIGTDGNFERIGAAEQSPRNINPVGGNVRTQGVQARKHLTVEQTEAAAKARFGQDAQVVRDVRALPWAYERLEKAIAGRTLIEELKGMAPTGKQLVANGRQPGFFTIDHPAFTTYRPRFTQSGGKVVPVLDQAGNIVFDKVPIYISEEMRGPLTAVLRNTPGGVTNTLYQGTMMAKSGATSLIMNSPMIHNMVEWGRALPAMPGKVASFRIYSIGRNTLKDMNLMRKAVGEDGLVPIGRGYQQDITGIAEATPGMGERKGMLSSLAGTLSPKASEAIDKAGQFWHEKLLWDQVAKLQAGLYSEIRSSLIAKGSDASTAGKIAAHMANRYAGALPNEAMSEGAKRLLNLALFSRSFTMGNLGVMKDIINGLPRDVRAIIGKNLTPVEKAAAQSLARRKAIGIFMKDIALSYFGVAMFEHALDLMKGDKSLGDIGQEYVDRYKRLLAKAKEHPLDVINPFNDAYELLPQSEHEPGKEARVPLFTQPDGTIIYGRLPTGKVGEEFQGWLTSPAPMIRNKLGTLARPLFNLLANDNGLGQKIWNPDAKGVSGVAHNIGNIVWEMIRTQVPEMQLEGMIDIIQGKGGKLPYAQVALPFAGLTVSKGAPGGPAVGEMMRERREAEARIKDALPNVQRLVKDGRIEDAQKRLQDVGASPREIKSIIGVYADPQRRLSKGRMKDFFRGATPEEADRMRRLLNIPAPAPQ